ncbi:MAG: Hsp20/alpha crystallin family protein [Pyrinomonadaceae bacterium]
MSGNQTKLQKVEKAEAASPVFVEAEKMFEKLAEISKETAAKAYDFFVERGSQIGTHFEDWLRAETEMLRAAPAKITESKDLVNVEIAVPGFKPNEIEVSVKDNVLIVSGETTTDDKKEDETTFYSEWRSDRFLRKLDLPEFVETDDIKAILTDGVLKLTLRKKAAAEAVKVAVHSA